MKNKTKFTFLTAILSLSLLLSACGGNSTTSKPQSSEPEGSSSIIENSSSSEEGKSSSSEAQSSSQSSSSSVASKHTVTFVVDGKTVQTSQVEDGGFANYEGAEPTKNPDDNAVKYRFKKWDKDLSNPITADTTFTAVFAEYAKEIIVDDFESYKSGGRMKEAGWAAWTLGSAGWTKETKAAVNLSHNAANGSNALRLDAWQNDSDFKAVKTLEEPYEKAANALQFKLMIPSEMKSVKVLLKGQITIEGKVQTPSFSYVLHPTSSEYMEYTIPLADDNWLLWDEEGKSIKEVAGWMGIHQDDYLNYLTSIDFYARGNDGLGGQPYRAFLDSVKFVTLDDAEFAQAQKLKQYDRYTGTLANGHILRVDLGANGSATAKVIDIEEPQTIPGNYVIENDQITFTSADSGTSLVYKGDITNGGQLIKYKSATGNFADAVLNMNLDAVQVVNNFEQYTEDGVAYSKQNLDKDSRSGLRGDFYSELYTGSGSSDWGKGGWEQMPEGDEINLKKDSNSAHSGNNYAGFKHFSQNGARYMPWNLFEGNGDKNSFRGSTLSMWVKGYVNKLRVSMYSQPAPTNETRAQYVKEAQFNEGKVVNEWTHIEVELNPKFVYYGFIILIDNDYQGDGELLVDDIEVYTANPYAKYEAPVIETFSLPINLKYQNKVNGLIGASLWFSSDTAFTLSSSGLNCYISGTYVLNDHEVTLTANGATCVATASEDAKQLVFTSVTGEDKLALATKDSTYTLADYAESAETYKEDGLMYYQGNTDPNKAYGARGAYYCEYAYSGSSTEVGGNGWILMGGNGDQLQLSTSSPDSGDKCLKMKASNAGDMRYFQWNLYKGDGEGHTGLEYFKIALSNSGNSINVEAKVMVFKVPKLTPATLIEDNWDAIDVTLSANQGWDMYSIDLDPNETYYGYGIWFKKASSAAFVSVDEAYYCHAGSDPTAFYYMKNDMTLSGKINNGTMDASFTVNEYGSGVFNCADLGMVNVPMTFKQSQVGTSTRIDMVIGDSTIFGYYSVNEDFKASFKFWGINGPLQAYIASQTLFEAE